MPDLKISEFAPGGAVQETDEIATNRSGVNTKVFVGSMAAEDASDYTPTSGLGSMAFEDDTDYTPTSGLGDAAFLDTGTAIGDVVELVDIGGAVPGLPAVDGSQLTGITSSDNLTIGTTTITGGSTGRVLYNDGGDLGELTAGSGYVAPNVVTSFTKQQNLGAAAITSTAASIAWNLDNAQSAVHTLTENTTLANPTNMVNGGTYVLRLVQDAATPRTLAFGSAYKWPGGVAPTISAVTSAIDILTFVSDGTNMYGVSQLAFA